MRNCNPAFLREDEEHFSMKFDSEWAEQNVPEHIDEAFGIVDRIREYEEEAREEEEDEEDDDES